MLLWTFFINSPACVCSAANVRHSRARSQCVKSYFDFSIAHERAHSIYAMLNFELVLWNERKNFDAQAVFVVVLSRSLARLLAGSFTSCLVKLKVVGQWTCSFVLSHISRKRERFMYIRFWLLFHESLWRWEELNSREKNRIADFAKCLFYTRIYRHHMLLTSIKNALEFRSNKTECCVVLARRMGSESRTVLIAVQRDHNRFVGIVKHFGIQIYLTIVYHPIYYTFHFWTEPIFLLVRIFVAVLSALSMMIATCYWIHFRTSVKFHVNHFFSLLLPI